MRTSRSGWRFCRAAAETSGTANVGGVLGARGCISKDAATGIYQISVAWQGSVAMSAPPAGIACGSGLYNSDATDTARRAVALTVLM